MKLSSKERVAKAELLGISYTERERNRVTEMQKKTERERKADIRGTGCCEGCWIKHVEIRAVQQALKILAGPRLNSEAQWIPGRNLLELNY